MRLIKTGPYIPGQEHLEIIQKWGTDIPDYAILSHTWGPPDDEVLLSDLQSGTSDRKPAFPKLLMALELAKRDGYGWLWIDTCCIDKSSSVELSEAINSMYAYYRDAQKCYAYLADVTTTQFQEKPSTCRWWRRGWTLQELLAPRHVEFFSGAWEKLGTKDSLHKIIYDVTGIEEEYLTGAVAVQAASIAKRMSWAAARMTTREEDLAYSLIGMFKVNMPMLYGEGGKQAFLRLQQEIMNSNEDQSIFAWAKLQGGPETLSSYHGLLADSPKDFERSGTIIPYSEGTDYNPSTMTARGLRVNLPLTPKADGTCIAALQCPVPSRGYSDWLAIYLQKLPHGPNIYARVFCGIMASVSEPGQAQEIYVRQHIATHTVQTVYPHHYFQIRHLTSRSDDPLLAGYRILYSKFATNVSREVDKNFPNVQKQPWSDPPLVYKIDKTAGALSAALLIQRPHDGESIVLMLGAKEEFNIGFAIYEADALSSIQTMQKWYIPEPPPAHTRLAFHDVRVSTEEHVRTGQKVYYVDIDITAIPKPPTVEEVLQDAVELVTQPIRGRGVNPTTLRNKVKRLWI